KTYFESYLKIRDNFNEQLQLILSTNDDLKFTSSNIPKLLYRNKSDNVKNIKLYFEPISDSDDILCLKGEKFRLVSELYEQERGDVLRCLNDYFKEVLKGLYFDEDDVKDFIDRLVLVVGHQDEETLRQEVEGIV